MPDTKVCIKSGEDVYSATDKALEPLNFHIKDSEKRVVIKPNLTADKPPESGIITHPESLRPLLERMDADIVIGEGSGGSTAEKLFDKYGYSGLAQDFGAELVDFDNDKIIKKEVENPLTSKRIPLAKTILDADLIISSAKLKTHSVTGVTLSMKNMFGSVPLRKNKLNYHFRIDRAIVDLMKVIKPDFCVLEGFPGNQGDEVISDPVDSNIVIAGEDPLSVDIVGSLCMGVNPEEVKHIDLLKEEWGEPKIDIIGKSIEEVKRDYKTKTKFKTKIRHGIEKIISYFL